MEEVENNEIEAQQQDDEQSVEEPINDESEVNVSAPDSESLIDNIILGDNVKAKTDFNRLMFQKTQDAINTKKQEFASSLISQ